MRAHKSLQEAAKAMGLSYRFAWGLLTAAAKDFGAPLVQLTRGRGGELSELGKKVLELDDRIGARLGPTAASRA